MQGYYLKNGATEGPLPMEDIFQKARIGEISPQTLVWNEAMDGWHSLAEAYPQMFGAGYSYASFWERFAAYCIDMVVCNVVSGMFGVVLIIINAFDVIDTSASFSAAYFLSLLASILYFTLMESSRFQGTLGKMALGIKVTGLNGERIPFGKAFLRYISKILSGFILMFGYLMMLWSPKKQCLHDQLAGTLVVKKVRR